MLVRAARSGREGGNMTTYCEIVAQRAAIRLRAMKERAKLLKHLTEAKKILKGK